MGKHFNNQRLTFHCQRNFLPIFSDGHSNPWYLSAIPGALMDLAEWSSALKNLQSGKISVIPVSLSWYNLQRNLTEKLSA